MKFLKRNKNIIITLVIFFILILFCIQIKNILFPNDGLAVYGNRLDGKIEVSKNLNKSIKEILPEGATKVTVRDAGRILNVTITVADDITRDVAKTYAVKSLEALSDEEIRYYDIQYFLVKNAEAAEFPVIGYKIPSAENISWTKDR